jgi:o-succinylbenzoate synthase
MISTKIYMHDLVFRFPAKTSRNTLTKKTVWYIQVFDENNPQTFGLGECNMLKGLSLDDIKNYDREIEKWCAGINEKEILNNPELKLLPSIRFGIETALLDLKTGGNRILFNTGFTAGRGTIPINGLIWMGDFEFMNRQLEEKLKAGYACIKIKIGAIDWEDELALLKKIRKQYPPDVIQIRLDANGAFKNDFAMKKLYELAPFAIHSIEQPIRPGQYDAMHNLILDSPIPIALDEELIPHTSYKAKKDLIAFLKPHFIVLKPSLLGGFKSVNEWIELAGSHHIDWWMTSALESNIGLNAIAQYTSTMENQNYQGLGTGQLYNNNIDSPLSINSGVLSYNTKKNWDLSLFDSTGANA